MRNDRQSTERGVLPRRSVLKDLFYTMLAFGTIVGLMFPPFARIALHTDRALSYAFFSMCVAAGIVVGVANYILFRVVVSRELSRVARAMKHINEAVEVASDTGEGCRDTCKIPVTSHDVVGQFAVSFNSMTDAIARRIITESTTRQLLAKLSTNVELNLVAGEILESLAGVCGATAGVLYGDTGNKLELLGRFGIDRSDGLPERIDASQGFAERALTTGKVMCASLERDGLTWFQMSTPLGGFRPESIVLAPLTAEQRTVGLVALACASGGLSDQEEYLIDAIRTQAAPYLQTAILHLKLQDLAAIDDLTRILNRRFGIRRLSEEFSRSVRHGVPLSVIMIDIDNFKSFNDTFGHDAGDAVLTSVASTLERNVRSGDVVCRYGGEELMVVAPGMGLHDAAAAAEKLRRQIESTPIGWRGQSLHVTASFGAASWPIVRASTPDEVVTAADQALYHAKESGRDRVSVHRGDEIVPLALVVADAA